MTIGMPFFDPQVGMFYNAHIVTRNGQHSTTGVRAAEMKAGMNHGRR
jgi:hypothetical protein